MCGSDCLALVLIDSSFESPFSFLFRMFLVLKLVWDRLYRVALTDLVWFEYRNMFLDSFSIIFFCFYCVEAIVWERLSHFRFD